METDSPRVKPDEFDGVWGLLMIHQVAIDLGYERVRADRGTDPRTGRYYEVGYGPMFQITLKTSLGEVLRTTAETWDSFTEARVQRVLKANLERIA